MCVYACSIHIKKSPYPTAASAKSSNASNKLWESLRPDICHFAESQQQVNDDKTTVKKFGFDAVAVIVQEPRVLYLDTSQVRLNNQSITWIPINQPQYQVHTTTQIKLGIHLNNYLNNMFGAISIYTYNQIKKTSLCL